MLGQHVDRCVFGVRLFVSKVAGTGDDATFMAVVKVTYMSLMASLIDVVIVQLSHRPGLPGTLGLEVHHTPGHVSCHTLIFHSDKEGKESCGKGSTYPIMLNDTDPGHLFCSTRLLLR